MQKIQILFPDPLMAKIRALSELEDRPVSEIIRRAMEAWLEKSSFLKSGPKEKKKPPLFDGGKILVEPDKLKGVIYKS